VDDGSTDQTWELVKGIKEETAFSIICLRKENSGPGSARNVGISKARGEILLIIGDDIFPDPNLLREHWTWHKERFPGDHVGVLGFVTWAPDPPPSPLMIWLERGYQNAYHLLRHGEPADWRHSYTGNMSIKRRFLEKTGELFDERLPPYGYEDIEWGYRLMKKGFVLEYNRNAVGIHHHWVMIGDSFRRMEKVGLSARKLGEINPELHELVLREMTPRTRWQSILLPVALCPLIMRPFILPVAKFLEQRKINSQIFALSHLYYFQRGFRAGV